MGGYTDSVTNIVTVGFGAPNMSYNSVCLGDSTIFTGVAPCNPIAWQWNFGDGSSMDTTQNTFHIYGNTGNYNVTLTTTWIDGYMDSITNVVTVLGDTGKADFYFVSSCGGDVQFYDSSLGNPISWQWDFGDINATW